MSKEMSKYMDIFRDGFKRATLNESAARAANGKSNRERDNEQTRMAALFEDSPLNEADGSEDKRADAAERIKSNRWEAQDPQRFKDALSKTAHGAMLSDYSVQDFAQMQLFKLDGYNIGFALKKMSDGGGLDIVSVFNNEPEVKKIGTILMQAAIDNGGCFLDHFDGMLSTLYETMGFKEYQRYPYDPQYDEGGVLRQKYGEVDVIYRKHQNCH
jgi:hypothetical protein